MRREAKLLGPAPPQARTGRAHTFGRFLEDIVYQDRVFGARGWRTYPTITAFVILAATLAAASAVAQRMPDMPGMDHHQHSGATAGASQSPPPPAPQPPPPPPGFSG